MVTCVPPINSSLRVDDLHCSGSWISWFEICFHTQTQNYRERTTLPYPETCDSTSENEAISPAVGTSRRHLWAYRHPLIAAGRNENGTSGALCRVMQEVGQAHLILGEVTLEKDQIFKAPCQIGSSEKTSWRTYIDVKYCNAIVFGPYG